MIETEAKIRLGEEEFSDLYEKLGRPDFVLQKNWGYVSGNNLVRVREEGEKKHVTLKMPNPPGKYNSREEIEFEVSDICSARRIFEILGLERRYYYEKNRAIREIGNCVVCLDKILGFGDFVEVEGETGNIECVLRNFGLDDKPVERRSYFEMLKTSI